MQFERSGLLSAASPDVTLVKRSGYAPDPADDGGAPALQRVFSAAKWIGLVNEVLGLQDTNYIRVYQASGSTIPAGPVAITGYFNGLGYLVNGTFAAGLQSINVDTGTLPIAIGSLFTIAGIYSNSPTNNKLQVFTSTVSLSGAGALAFTPPLPTGAADNAVIVMDAGYRIAKAVGVPADLLLLSSVATQVAGYAFKQGQFTGSIDTSGAAFGDPVYLKSDGSYSLTADAPSVLTFKQIIARVETKANPGVLRGTITLPIFTPIQLVDGDSEVSIDSDARILYDDGLNAALEWGNSLLKASGVTVMDWAASVLKRAGVNVLDWNYTQLQDQDGELAADWDARLLYDDSTNLAADWNNRKLQAVSGASGGPKTCLEWGEDGSHNQKLGLFGVTPVVQPAAITNSVGGDEMTKINAILAALRSLGVITP